MLLWLVFPLQAEARIELWTNALFAWWEKPIFGWGLGSFDWAYNAHRTDYLGLFPSMRTILPWPTVLAGAAHNAIMNVLVELGLIGALLVAVVAAAVLRRARGMYRAVIVLGIGTMMVGFPEQNPNTAILMAVAAGLAVRV